MDERTNGRTEVDERTNERTACPVWDCVVHQRVDEWGCFVAFACFCLRSRQRGGAQPAIVARRLVFVFVFFCRRRCAFPWTPRRRNPDLKSSVLRTHEPTSRVESKKTTTGKQRQQSTIDHNMMMGRNCLVAGQKRDTVATVARYARPSRACDATR